MKITLPVSGDIVELAVWSWAETRSYFERLKAYMAQGGKTSHDWMEHSLREDYPAKIIDKAMEAAPDAITLYNETLRYNQAGPEAVKNSCGSGTGKQTQSESDTAGPAAAPEAAE